MSDSHKKSLLKAITWRVIATLTTTVATLIVTGKIELALGVGAIDIVAKIFLYYFHERLWNKMKF